ELKLVGRDRERCDLLYLELPLAAERLDPSADADVIPGLDPRVGLLVVIPDPSLDLPAPVTEQKPKVGLLLPGPCELFVRDAVARRVARALEEGIQRGPGEGLVRPEPLPGRGGGSGPDHGRDSVPFQTTRPPTMV